MATATIWACAPSCRSRSIRRSLAAESSTARARACSSSRTRCGKDTGLSSRAISAPSQLLTIRVSHGDASNATAPTGTRAKAAGQVRTSWATCTGSAVHHESHEGIRIPAPRTTSHHSGKVRYGSPYSNRKPATTTANRETGSLSTK
jgi:hypothetical protein